MTMNTTPESDPLSPDSPPSEMEVLGRTIKQVQYRHHRVFDAALAAVGTTLAQWDALRAIARHPGASAHDLAGLTFQSDQAFGTLASRLIMHGMIERRPGRGRRIEHHLTATGATMLEAGRPLAQAILTVSFADLSEQECATLLSLLNRIIAQPLDVHGN